MDRDDIVCQSECTDFPKIDSVDINWTDASKSDGGGGTKIPLEMPVPISTNVADT